MDEPIAKCCACRGEGILAGEPLPEVCEPCRGLGIVATERPMALEPIKTCLCGASYDADAWALLAGRGLQEDGAGGYIELRDCTCGSTIAIELPREVAA